MNGLDRRISGGLSVAVDSGGGGLGSLADELADALEEEEAEAEGEGEEYEYASGAENTEEAPDSDAGMDGHYNDLRSETGLEIPSARSSPERHLLQLPPKQRQRNGYNQARHHRRHESQYDGSDYGNESDLEEAGNLSPGLETQMAAIEALARRRLENNGSENDHIIARAVESLRDLGGQSGIENSAMRLITAHTSLASHLTHQTRILQTLIHPLLFSPFLTLSADAIDALLPLIDGNLLNSLPSPFPGRQSSSSSSSSSSFSQPTTTPSHEPTTPLHSLQSLISHTSDLIYSLRSLGDTLYESRQLTATVSRRLRSVRDLAAELRREGEDREEGTRWIEKGDWDRRLRERHAGRECGEVVRGFEAVCGEWRERILRGAAAAVAA